VFVSVILIGTATFAGAYYLPLYKAHQTLNADYQKLSHDAQSSATSLRTTQAELKATNERLDTLQNEHDQRERDKKASTGKLETLKTDLSTKLDKLIKKGSLSVSNTSGGGLLIGFDPAFLFVPQKLDLAAPGHGALCDIAKAATVAGATLHAHASLTEEGTVPTALQGSFTSPWSFTAARAAAIAQNLEEKCAVPSTRLSASGDAKRDPFARDHAPSPTAAGEIIELEIRFDH